MPKLTVMHQDQQQPSVWGGQPVSDGRAVEDHGRAVTTTVQAAAFYRQAQQAVDWAQTLAALRQAVHADPAFALALADIDAITQAPSRLISGHPMNWERHHIEVVHTAAAGNVSRAADLLREHLASVGCDPLALQIVARLGRRTGGQEELEDIAGERPRCHATHWDSGRVDPRGSARTCGF